MLIEQAKIKKNCLKGKTVLLTGAGGGIGFEAARALVWLGANAIIAEINKDKGIKAEKAINEELNTNQALFYEINIEDEKQINKLYSFIKNKYGFLDVIFNNATITPLGAVHKVKISDWDKSYGVNLRGPILLAQKFLPDMKYKNKGIIVFVSSSGAAPYMGAYEIFKTSQVELCNILAGELENTNIYTYCMAPGLVKTETAHQGIEKVAALMNISTEEFYLMNESHMLDAEHAGVGFAASIAFAEKYNGQEVGSIQALMDAGIISREKEEVTNNTSNYGKEALKSHIANVIKIYNEQYQGWLQRNIFERQWVLRDFKKEVKLSADQFKNEMENIRNLMEQREFASLRKKKKLFISLKKYYEHQYKLLQGYEKDAKKLKDNSQVILRWIEELQIIIDILL